MIINNIKYDTHSRLVERLNHLLELLDTGHRVERIGRVRTLYSIIVERIIAPVVLVVLKMFFINRNEVSGREKLDICHAELLKMINTCCKSIRIPCSLLCKSEIFSLIADTGSLMNRKITVMHLVDNDVRRFDFGTLILSPTLRIGLVPIYDSTSPSIHSYRLGCYAGSLRKPLSVFLDLESIERTIEVLSDHCLPKSVLSKLHVHCHEGILIGSRLVKLELSGLSHRSPDSELSLVTFIYTLLKRCLRDSKPLICSLARNEGDCYHCRHQYKF